MCRPAERMAEGELRENCLKETVRLKCWVSESRTTSLDGKRQAINYGHTLSTV